MQNEVLRTLCILSATGAVLTLAVYALAPLARRFLPARWLKNAATLVLLAYALPVWLALPPLSALLPARSAPQAQDAPPAATETVQEAQTAPVQAAADPEPMQQTVPVVHDETAAQPRQFPAGIVLAVWGAGAALMLCRTLVSYAVFWHRLKKQGEPVEVCALLEACRAEAGVRRRVRLCRTELVRAPALAGLVRPAILLPWGDFSADDLRAALLHELHHLKSRDLARKWLAALVQCVHWWNPFAYLAARLLHQSCETACDLAVTGKMDSAGRAAYMKAVLAFAAAGVKAPPLTTAMSAGGREIERRFTMIARQKPIKLFARLTALALTACLLVSGLGVGALALNASEGKLLSYSQNDIFPHSTLHFEVNIGNSKNWPSWLGKVVGADKKIEVTLTVADVRDRKGQYSCTDYITLSGANGTYRLTGDGGPGWGTLDDSENPDIFMVQNYNRQISNWYSTPDESHDYAIPCTPDNGESEMILLRLVYTEPDANPQIEICFTREDDESRNVTSDPLLCRADVFHPVAGSISCTGLFAPSNALNETSRYYYTLVPTIFGISETNYQNTKVNGIAISLQQASANQIVYDYSITRPEPVAYRISVCSVADFIPLALAEGSGYYFSVPLDGTIHATPDFEEMVSGETYRVEIALLDAAGSVIYRQLEHVTIP